MADCDYSQTLEACASAFLTSQDFLRQKSISNHGENVHWTFKIL